MEYLSYRYQTIIKPLVDKYILENGVRGLPTALCITSAAALIASTLLWRSSGLTSKQGGRKKVKNAHNEDPRKPVPLTLEGQIENVRLRFNDEYKTGALRLIEEFDSKDEKKIYERNYYNEMLLKLLIELDGVDLGGVEGDRKIELKERRKAVIKDIQAFLKKLDRLR